MGFFSNKPLALELSPCMRDLNARTQRSGFVAVLCVFLERKIQSNPKYELLNETQGNQWNGHNDS